MAKPRYKRNAKGQFAGSASARRQPAPPTSLATPSPAPQVKTPVTAGIDYDAGEQIDRLTVALSVGFKSRKARRQAREQLTQLFGEIDWAH